MSDRSADPPTVIVVDDDAGVRKALRYSREIEGFEVVSCHSGEALLQLAVPGGPVCLVLDQNLPGTSGIEALETLRGRGVEIPAIMITSAPDAPFRARALLANARVVEKPLLTDLLSGAIRDAL